MSQSPTCLHVTQLPISTPNLVPPNPTFYPYPQPGPTQPNFPSLPPTTKPLLSVSGATPQALHPVSVASTSCSETWFLDPYGTFWKVYKTLRIQYVQLVIMIKNLKSRKPARYLIKQRLHLKLTHSGVERLHLQP